MDNYDKIFQKCSLFKGIDAQNYPEMLKCLSGTIKKYEKQEYIFSAGDKAEKIGVILSGCVDVVHDDFWANRVILSRITAAGIFGEAFACAEVSSLPVSVIAAEKCEILLMNYNEVFLNPSDGCRFRPTLTQNMLRILAGKNVMFTKKIEYLSKRSIREKVMAFLSDKAEEAGNGIFSIGFNRQQLADYLCVDRSALSRELSIMKADGVIDFEKNIFKVKKS